MTQRVLFLGGTGVISAACVRRVIETGKEVTIVTRGASARPPHPEAHVVTADVRSPGVLERIVREREYDAVVDVLGFTPEQVAQTTDAVRGRCGQYVFVSSATVYERPPRTLPVAENAPQANPHWEYARLKIAAEALLRSRMAEGLPATIVRPSHTYDDTRPVTLGGWTDLARISAGEPVFVHDDPTTRWTITHARDFAVLFDALLGDPRAVGGAFNVMGEEAPSFLQIYDELARACGVAEPVLVRVPGERIADVDARFGERVLGDHAYSMIFDTSRVRALAPDAQTTVPFAQGAAELVRRHRAMPPAQQRDPAMDARIEAVLAAA